MTDVQRELITFLIQIIVLIAFALLLKDILAALVVSFLSRPLAKMGIDYIYRNLNKRQTRNK